MSTQSDTGTAPIIWEPTGAELQALIERELGKMNLTREELIEQARKSDFSSSDARSLWFFVGWAIAK